MSWVKTEIEEGIGLDDEEIQELVDMVYEDKYYQHEIADWFGITKAKIKTYLKIADRKEIYPSSLMGKIDGKNYSNLDLIKPKYHRHRINPFNNY